jgi:TonB-linked SusC/RagA family outer membrane protein
MKKILLLTSVFTLILITGAQAQNQTITGTVISKEDGEPMIGVSVLLQGTNKGVSTGIDGTYSIQAAPGENILVFTFIGYKSQTIEIGNRTVIDVVMEADATELTEIVVVGYGVQKKSDITGATVNVKAEELTRQPVINAAQALQGKAAGVQIISSGQPGVSPQVRIRGVSTALAGTTALYVVDNVLTDDISNINPADIVDINILKDASAAAIYGSRGANGVIIITTKKGVSGEFKINYSNNIGVRQASNLVEMANADEYRNYVLAASGANPVATPFDTDWYDTILRTAFQQNHNLSLSGGSEKSTFFLNLGYLAEEGIVINNDFKRFTVRLNQENKISEKWKFGIQSSFGNSVNNNGFGNIDIDAYGNIGSAYNNAYRAAPIIADINDGLYGNTSLYQNVGNPLLGLNKNEVRVKDNRLQASGYLEYKPITWVTLRTSIGTDLRNSLNRVYFYKFLSEDTDIFLPIGGNQQQANSSLSIKQTQNFRWVWDNTATFTKEFGKHDFTLLVGVTAEKFNRHTFGANRNDVPADPDLWYIDIGDANSSQNSGSGDAWARNSYLARLNYSYNEKYLFTATVRRDGSSRLPSQNRWQTYPSFGAGWIVSRENFMQNQNIFDFLKLRASYGKVGNDQIPTDAFTQTVTLNKPYAFNGSVSEATNGAQITQIVDPNITWEITEEYDLALEFGVFNSRLTGEVNYYNKKVNNALINIPILSTVGDIDALVITNAAAIQNKGVEVVLNWNDQVSDDFSYSIGANATFNKNDVLNLNGGQAIIGGSIGASQGFTTYTVNGNPVGSFYVLRTLGVFNTAAEVTAHTNSEGTIIQETANPGDFKYDDINDDGKIDDLDRVFAGSYQPVAYFGLNLGAKYKGWDLNVGIYGNVGNEVYNGKRAVRVDNRDNIERDVVYDRWTAANRNQSNPSAGAGANQLASDYYVESGDFLRINNVTLGYNFSNEFLQRYKISNMRLFITAQNLFTFQKFSGFTPELPGDPINSGIELSTYPTTRTFTAGINVGF